MPAMTWEKLLCTERPRKSTNSPGDHRAEFERDFDRSIFSTPVKRLQDKAQVFPLEPHDAVRTRLTHSLEVSTVARGIATAVGKWLLEKGEINAGQERWIEAIAATCGLVHDLGNPPFGHSGEDAIREWFRKQFKGGELLKALADNKQFEQDFLNFEGNAQSLRLVGKLQVLADFNGLNLTFGTLSALGKYIAPSHEVVEKGDHAKSKPGYFASENQLIARIREMTGTGAVRNPITFLVEAADDIVYSAADVEDAVKKGVLSWDAVEKWMNAPGVDISVASAFAVSDAILKAGAATVPDDLPEDTYAAAFRTAAIGVVVRSVVEAFKDRYSDIMNGEYRGELVDDCSAAEIVKRLKKLARQKVYRTPSILKLELMGREVIHGLMDNFWEGAESLPKSGAPKSGRAFHDKLGFLLSENYRRVFADSVKRFPDIPELYHRLQLVTDYVCGMTDTFAIRLHSELTNG